MDINPKNISTLIRFMEGLNDPKFSMDEFFHRGCRTPACALGWATTIPEFAYNSEREGIRTMSARVFGPDAYKHLFNAINCWHIKTPQQWAEHARSFLKANGFHVDLPFSKFMERVLKPVPEATPDFVGYTERFPR